MTGERPAILVLGAMVALALVAGIISVGGPMRGAMEKRDDARYQDLMHIRNQVQCVSEGGDAPQTPEPTPNCDFGARLTDPVSGEPYGYEVIDANTIRLCAAFENPERIAERVEGYMGRFENGCLTTRMIRG